MSRKKAAAFGTAEGPGITQLRTANGTRVPIAISEWRRMLDHQAQTIPDDNFGWLRTVYLVPLSLARSWASFFSVDRIVQHEPGRKRLRLRGSFELDGRLWTPSSQEPLDAEGKGHVDLVELLDALTFTDFPPMNYAQRMTAENVRRHGSNYRGVGPVYRKTGDEAYVLGYTARAFAVDGLELGQWFKVQLPAAPTW